MMWFLCGVWLVAGRTRGRVPATPTGPRPQTSLYPPGQRLPTEGGSVGSFFVFINKRRDRVKILYWDRDGLAVWAKRLERGTYLLPDATASRVEMTTAELAALLAGIDLNTARRRHRYARPATPLQNSENFAPTS
jgi:IS66 Orf2 like protein